MLFVLLWRFRDGNGWPVSEVLVMDLVPVLLHPDSTDSTDSTPILLRFYCDSTPQCLGRGHMAGGTLPWVLRHVLHSICMYIHSTRL